MLPTTRRDLADQLTSETRLGYAASYTYDANGNRATRTVNGQTETHVSDAADKLMSISVGGNTVRSFTYDGRGRRKTDTYAGSTTTYSWDAESRLTSLARPGVTTSSFGYNGLDARVSKTDSTGTFSFKRNGAGVTDPVLSDGAATYTPGISERRAGSSKFLHSGMKNADAQSGASANVDSSRTYDAFGNLTGSSGTWSGPFGYAGGFGYQEDPDHGLRLLGHRYYDSSTGRFISKDPIGDGRNWTAYCGNNPLTRVDPKGLFFETALDLLSLSLDLLDFKKSPSLAGGLMIGWGVAALILPGVPGTWVGKAIKHGSKYVGLRGEALDKVLREGFKKRMVAAVGAKAGHYAHHIIPVSLADDVLDRFGKSFPGGEAALIEFLRHPSNGMWADERHKSTARNNALNAALREWLRKNPRGTFEQFFNYATGLARSNFGGG